ncbi:unnamed protein product [Ambrosiozyma monospora]|uniref:Checkpoint protein n=1 Tax=Ambrosiozyma monospora TaxID=43982 RepID=A0A9W6T6Y3_AMBMO|nr:unnamed protein product [Ambrosiozyma monospora]
MKVKVLMDDIDNFKNALSYMLTLRKLCVLRFTPERLTIISSAVNEPQIWCNLDQTSFQHYEVESTRNGIISMEVNIEPLFHVLKNYENVKQDSLLLRLQRRPSDNSNKQAIGNKDKSAVCLSIIYEEFVTVTTTISHSFNIPARLLKATSDERIQNPDIRNENVHVAMKITPLLAPFFKRIERYKTSDTIQISANKLGYLNFKVC